MRDDSLRLQDVQEAIDNINRYANQGREEFDTNELVQTWIVHHLVIIGEAMRNVSVQLRSKHTEIDWAKIIGMRNFTIHEYFGINYDIIWDTVEYDLPELKRHIEIMLQELQSNS